MPLKKKSQQEAEERYQALLRDQKSHQELEQAAAFAIQTDTLGFTVNVDIAANQTFQLLAELESIAEIFDDAKDYILRQKKPIAKEQWINEEVQQENLHVLADDFEDAEYLTESAIPYLQRRYNISERCLRRWIQKKRNRFCNEKKIFLEEKNIRPIYQRVECILLSVFERFSPRPRPLEIACIQRHLTLNR